MTVSKARRKELTWRHHEAQFLARQPLESVQVTLPEPGTCPGCPHDESVLLTYDGMSPVTRPWASRGTYRHD